MGNTIVRLKSEILHEVDQKVAVLETRIEAKMNKTHRNIAITPQDIKEAEGAIQDRQQKMEGYWWYE